MTKSINRYNLSLEDDVRNESQGFITDLEESHLFFNSSDVVDQFSDKFLLTNPHKTKTERKSKGSRRKRKRDSRAEEKLLQSNILSGEIVSPENAKIVKPQSDS